MAKAKKEPLNIENDSQKNEVDSIQETDIKTKVNVENADDVSKFNVPLPDVSIASLTSTTDTEVEHVNIVEEKVRKTKNFSFKSLNILDSNTTMWIAASLFLILYAWVFTMLFIYASPKSPGILSQSVNAIFTATEINGKISYQLSPTAIGFVVVLAVFLISAIIALISKTKYKHSLFDNKLAHSKIFLGWTILIFASFIAMIAIAFVPPFLDHYETATVWYAWATNPTYRSAFNSKSPTNEIFNKGEDFLKYLGVSFDASNKPATINTIIDQMEGYSVHSSYSIVWDNSSATTNVFSVAGIAIISIFSICLATIPLFTPILLLILNSSEIKELAKQSNKKRMLGISNKISKIKQKQMKRKAINDQELEDFDEDENDNLLVKNLKDVNPKRNKMFKVKKPNVPIKGLTTPIDDSENSNADTQTAKNIRKNKKQKIATPDKELEDIFDSLDI